MVGNLVYQPQNMNFMEIIGTEILKSIILINLTIHVTLLMLNYIKKTLFKEQKIKELRFNLV